MMKWLVAGAALVACSMAAQDVFLKAAQATRDEQPMACLDPSEAVSRAVAAAQGAYVQGVCGHVGKYRCDCSGLVSYAWRLPLLGQGGPVTQQFNPSYCARLGSWDELRPADAILKPSEHVEFFVRWDGSNFISAACHDPAEGCSHRSESLQYFKDNGFFPCRPRAAYVCGGSAQGTDIIQVPSPRAAVPQVPMVMPLAVVKPLACIDPSEAVSRAVAAARGAYVKGVCGHVGSYRCDCSGLVSYAWRLPLLGQGGPVTGQFHPTYCAKLGSWDELQPADAILKPSVHVEFFVRWDGSSNFISAACHDPAEGCSHRSESIQYFKDNGFFPCRPHAGYVCGGSSESISV